MPAAIWCFRLQLQRAAPNTGGVCRTDATDAGTDAGTDATDAGTDAGTDATDASTDAGTDTGADDCGADASVLCRVQERAVRFVRHRLQ